MSLPRWNELASLPYVELTEYTGGTRENYYDEDWTEKMCLRQDEFAASYDWAMIADIDEYLWFPEHVGVKEFLQRYSSMTYLSFGKQIYTLDHGLDLSATNHTLDTTESSGFAVSKYPFYMKHFCHHRHRKGDPICPTWRGRAKLIVRPSVHTSVTVHGTIEHPNPDEGTIHFHADFAHFKEWPEIFAAHDVMTRPPQNFIVQRQDEVHIHNMHTGFKPIDGDNGEFLVMENGRFLVEYDDLLQDWFDFVVSRATK